MIIWIILLILISICVKYSFELRKFNSSAELIQLQNPTNTTINELLNKKSPLIVHNLASRYLEIDDLTIDNLVKNNPGYIIKDNDKHILFSSFLEENQQISENPFMIKDFKIEKKLDEILKIFTNNLSCNLNHKFNIYKGNYKINLTKNNHDNLIYSQLSGETIFYLFNPKHKNDIINKENQSIKKWGFKISLKPGIILSIPPEWFFIYEIHNYSVLSSSYYDSYFTYVYNMIK
jgi:hypothetical protein